VSSVHQSLLTCQHHVDDLQRSHKDDSMNWKQHISYVCSPISRNTRIIANLRHYLSTKQLKQIYYNLIYPYISYTIMAWGSAYSTHLMKIQTKQNHIIRLIFFATLYGRDTASAKPLLNLLEVLTVKNVYNLHILKFMHLWHIGALPSIFKSMFKYARDVHKYNTRYSRNSNLYKSKVRTNIGKQLISFTAIAIWNSISIKFKFQLVFQKYQIVLTSTTNKRLYVVNRHCLYNVHL